MPRRNDAPEGAPVGPVQRARRAFLEGAGSEIASAFPGITRLGGQLVAALYLDDTPRSMDALASELGFSKSNVFGNLRALESAGILERRREAGSRHDTYALRGPYPDVVIGAYVSRLRRITADKIAVSERALELLGGEGGDEADTMRERLVDLRRKYTVFANFFAQVMPAIEGPIDLERMLNLVPPGFFEIVAQLTRSAMVWPPREEGLAAQPARNPTPRPPAPAAPGGGPEER